MITDTKYFTPKEARLSLPLVKKIVKDILDTTKEVRLLAEDLEGEIDNNPKVKKMVEDINHFIGELEEIGCFYKDWSFSVGLVDFPSLIDGKEVLLCWRSDEEDVTYFHDYEAGYAGRKPIPEEYI